jgi:hypothetical protein
MRAEIIALLLGAVLFAGSASAYDANDPGNCLGADWDDSRALVVSKVTAEPRIDFIKTPTTMISRANPVRPRPTLAAKAPIWFRAISCWWAPGRSKPR